MFTAYMAVTIAAILANAASAAADQARVRYVLNNSAEVGVPHSWLTPLAALKALAAVGLLLGLLGVPLVGTAAAAGLVALFVGALTVHTRARVFYNIAFPAGYFALAVATLVLALTR
ncbi:DoxX family protein [Streptomyces iconiensis]|uniref:DoxX family protein n=1 Tax=Streptomyces iconiensis TaxID=1384038 RepID=A0ABT6ZQV9_9ACTN|nr:DoxX family protein [Streptomyces iconiensis]MDJ1131445.1 DoxX family protein [Streptomyces iconiensis]